MDLQQLHRDLAAIPMEKLGGSQLGEAVIIKEIFRHIGTTNQYLVDIGAGYYDNEIISNSGLLMAEGWDGLLIDADTKGNPKIKQYFVTPDNIDGILYVNNVPTQFDLLTIDIDSFDLDVLEAIMPYYVPRVICTEFNGCLFPEFSLKLKYEEGYTWDGTDKYGYSLAAGLKFARKWGYRVVLNHVNMNLFMVLRAALGDQADVPLDISGTKQDYHAHNENAEWVRY